VSCPPVLLLVCDRPEPTRRVFERVREARPGRLFVAADGPRPGRPSALAEATAVDWGCELETLVRDRNLGCKEAVGSAITWFMERAGEGIVLEDDCVPDPSFFPYCAELLERYRDDGRVAGIGGSNYRGPPADGASYAFSIYNQTWGWATWRRAWAAYDPSLARWPELRESGWLEGLLRDRAARRFWREVFDRDHRGEIDTWDFAWTFACWAQRGLTAQPAVNLVTNIGFGADATHTTNAASPLANVPAREIAFPLVHPAAVASDTALDRFTSEHVHRVRFRTSRLRRALYSADSYRASVRRAISGQR
jgi:hypothetical protein